MSSSSATPTEEPQSGRKFLFHYLPAAGRSVTSDDLLERFVGWVADVGLTLYPAQEEAILEVMSGRHVVLNTPTGSGKSLVALAMHFKTAAEGGRSFYTSPIKALASEKFFDLCEQLGAERVGMLTGDASINPDAPVICCTAEILSNLALREGRHAPVDSVVMDEFHYYADSERGMAWQVPLLLLPDATFLLMSATLGDLTDITRDLEERSEREVTVVKSRDRPVPLDFSYREVPLHETVQKLLEEGRSPIYVVNFTQREAAEQAQNFLSINFCTKEEKQRIKEAVGQFRFDTPYGKDIRRFVLHGVGLHHAGLLPKYRRLVEQLAQQGLLKLISGTDTLGVGVNVPIRTVLFTKLCKFDGDKVRVLSVRDFQQIAGRAGRKGYDDHGSVVAQAPEHVIENKQLEAKLASDPKKKRKQPKKKAPLKGYVHYDTNTFERLIASEPERLISSFGLNHGILMNLLNRELTHGRRDSGYRQVVELISLSHESPRAKTHLRRHAAGLFRSLRHVGIVTITRPEWDPRPYVTVRPTLQREFSLFQTLAVYLVETLAELDQAGEDYVYELASLVEAILQSPRVVLLRQEDKLKRDALTDMKARGLDYEDRVRELEKITYPKPNAEFIYHTFDAFRELHPWVRHENVQPKSVVREMFERYASFHEYVREYGLQRSEGVLLRYVSEVYKTLIQTVPAEAKTEEVQELIAFVRGLLAHVDTSLILEWESLLDGEGAEEAAPTQAPARDITRDPKAFARRVRAEMHLLIKALSTRAYDDAAACLRTDDPTTAWSADMLEQAMERFYDGYSHLVFDHRARLSDKTLMRELGRRHWQVRQILVDPEGDNSWAVEAEIELDEGQTPDGPLLTLVGIGP